MTIYVVGSYTMWRHLLDLLRLDHVSVSEQRAVMPGGTCLQRVDKPTQVDGLIVHALLVLNDADFELWDYISTRRMRPLR